MMPILPHPITRQVQSLLLHNNRVTVITHADSWDCFYAICGGSTTAFLYEFDQSAKLLTLLTQIDITGSFNGARSIGSYEYIITNAYINTWSFTQKFSRCNDEYSNMTTEEYEEAAVKLANRTVVS
jgi:hypothetical protein